jgi:hypothetical protein
MASVNSMEQFQGYFGLSAAEAGTGVVFVRHSERCHVPYSPSLRECTRSDKSAPFLQTSICPTNLVVDGPCSSPTFYNGESSDQAEFGRNSILIRFTAPGQSSPQTLQGCRCSSAVDS